MEPLVDDIGSFPLPKDANSEKFSEAYRQARELAVKKASLTEDPFVNENFSRIILDSFRRKAATGLDVINFPQHYDGMRQVGDVLHAAMEKGSFVVEEDRAVLPEVYLLNQEAKALSEEFGKKIQLRVSIFGPLEQYLKEVGTTAYPDVLDGFAETIRRFAKQAVLNTKYIETKVVSIDEPSFGINNVYASQDLVCDVLEKAYDFHGATRQIHLHSSTRMQDLLCVKNLDVLSFEYAASPLNIESVPKNMIKEADKHIRVGIARTDIDTIWAEFAEMGVEKPSDELIVDSVDAIRKRFRVAKEKYGDVMSFTGPDCGLGSWPSQDAAALVLKRTVEAVKSA
jgi:5-methyltetrahydropteroyltriglutamate--homocysteine methyltransferase